MNGTDKMQNNFKLFKLFTFGFAPKLYSACCMLFTIF